jgi:kynureninase
LSLVLNTTPERAKDIHAALNDSGIVCDWREPNVLRVAPIPLYNTYTDAWKLVLRLSELIV